MNSDTVVGLLAEGDSPISLTTIGTRTIRAAADRLLRTHASGCGHPAPWFAKPGDALMRCPACMQGGATYNRWSQETQCTGCGADASDADVWLIPFTDELLLVLRLCGACRVDVTPINLEEEIRR